MSRRTRSVVVAGTKVTLEERECSGGCGKKFWVQKNSKHTTARRDCQEVCNNVFLGFMKTPKATEEEKKQGFNLAAERLAVKKLWSINVEKVKVLMNKERYWESERMNIAALAIEVTYSKFDDSKRRKIMRGLSITNFALSTGLDQRTLAMWVTVKKYVINKLSDQSIYQENMYKIAKNTYNLVTRDSDPKKVEKIFREKLKNRRARG